MSARREIREESGLSMVVKGFEPQRPLSLGSATYLMSLSGPQCPHL